MTKVTLINSQFSRGHPYAQLNISNVTKYVFTLYGSTTSLSGPLLPVPDWSLMSLSSTSLLVWLSAVEPSFSTNPSLLLPPSVKFDSRTVSIMHDELPTCVHSGGDKRTIRGSTSMNNFLMNRFLTVPTLWWTVTVITLNMIPMLPTMKFTRIAFESRGDLPVGCNESATTNQNTAWPSINEILREIWKRTKSTVINLFRWNSFVPNA